MQKEKTYQEIFRQLVDSKYTIRKLENALQRTPADKQTQIQLAEAKRHAATAKAQLISVSINQE